MAKGLDVKDIGRARHHLDAAATQVDIYLPTPANEAARNAIKQYFSIVDMFLEDLLTYATQIAVSNPQPKTRKASEWRVVGDLVWLIVNEKFQGMDAEHVIAGLARGNIGNQVDQQRVAEHIVEAHNAEMEEMLVAIHDLWMQMRREGCSTPLLTKYKHLAERGASGAQPANKGEPDGKEKDG